MLLCFRPRRGRGYDPWFYGSGRNRAVRARRRNVAVPVSVHGESHAAAGCSPDRLRAAVAEAARQCPDLPLFAGGKSFGGRMTSQAQATVPLAHVHGLVFLGFPLHPAGKPSVERTKHLFDIQLPMLFLQGTRDKLAELPLLERTTQKLGTRASLRLFENADHSFHVPARSGRNDRDVMDDILNSVAAWVGARLSDQTPFDAIRAT